MKSIRNILISLVLGIIFAVLIRNLILDPELTNDILNYLALFSDIFIKLIKMIVAPLIFSSLSLGIMNIGNNSQGLSKLFFQVLGIFIISSIVSLFIGWIVIDLFKPGLQMQQMAQSLLASGTNNISNSFSDNKLSLNYFIRDIIPENIFHSFSSGHIIQIVIFSILFGLALNHLAKPSKDTMFHLLDATMHAMFRICHTIMKLVPLAVFSSVAHVIIQQGFEILYTYLLFILEYYFALLIVWIGLYLISRKVVGVKINRVLTSIAPALGFSFATSSSEAAFPAVFEALEKNRIREKISSFVLPMGYSFNMIGSMVYFSFAIIFITQVFAIEISFLDKLYIFLVLLITSKGIAGVPRASIMVITSAVTAFHFPPASILLLLPIDAFADMGRSATNVYANTLTTVLIDKWYKEK